MRISSFNMGLHRLKGSLPARPGPRRQKQPREGRAILGIGQWRNLRLLGTRRARRVHMQKIALPREMLGLFLVSIWS
jgi:hypothetical protein